MRHNGYNIIWISITKARGLHLFYLFFSSIVLTSKRQWVCKLQCPYLATWHLLEVGGIHVPGNTKKQQQQHWYPSPDDLISQCLAMDPCQLKITSVSEGEMETASTWLFLAVSSKTLHTCQNNSASKHVLQTESERKNKSGQVRRPNHLCHIDSSSGISKH